MTRPEIEPKALWSQLPEVRRRFAADLFDDFLPFMNRHVIDPAQGGFPCLVNPDGSRASPERMTWFEGRGVWVYSHLYRTLSHDEHHLRIAERALGLLDRTAPASGPSGRPRHLSPDGSAAGPPDPEVYSDLFVAEGMAAFAHATADASLWERAALTVGDCLRRLHSADYHAALDYVSSVDGLPLVPEPHLGLRPLGAWMMIARTLAELLRFRRDAELEVQWRAAVWRILDDHVNRRFGLLNEVTAPDPRAAAAGFVYLGHAIEALWMVLDGALLIGDRSVFDRASALFRRHCDVARDPVYGGLFRALVDVDRAHYSLDKTLWVQQEAMNGALLLVERCADPWAASLFVELDSYVHDRFPLRELGSVVWREVTDRTATALPAHPRVEHYHHPRMLMRVLLACDRSAEGM